MGCNCNKRKPVGPRTSNQNLVDDPTKARMRQPARPTPPPSGETQTFTLSTSDGRTQTFGSRLEAEAERIRRGGGSIF